MIKKNKRCICRIDEEYLYPREILEEEGINVSVASRNLGEACGMLGARIEPDLLLSEAISEGKILAAICIAPVILAYAEVLEGVKATVWLSEKDRLVERGALYRGRKTEVDGKIITANGPNAARDFGNKILEALKENLE